MGANEALALLSEVAQSIKGRYICFKRNSPVGLAAEFSVRRQRTRGNQKGQLEL